MMGFQIFVHLFFFKTFIVTESLDFFSYIKGFYQIYSNKTLLNKEFMDSARRRPLILLMILSLVTRFRGGIISPILSLFMRGQGLSITEIGLLGTAQMMGWLVFEPLMGIVADRVQKRYMIIVAIIGSTIIYASYPFADTLLHFALLGFSMSSVMSAYAIAVKALTAELLPRSSMGKTYGRYLSMISFGGVIAPFVGGFISELADYTLPFYISAILGIFALLSVILMSEKEKTKESSNGVNINWTEMLTKSIIGIFTVRGIYLFNLVFRQSFLPIYLNESPNFLASESEIGSYLTITGIATSISQALLGDIVDQIGSRKMITICVGVLGFTYLGFIYLQGVWMIYLLGVIQGIFLAGADMSMMIHLISIMPENQTGMVMGLYSESENIGGIIASPSFGYIYDSYGSNTSIWVLAAILLANTFISWVLLKKDRTINKKKNSG